MELAGADAVTGRIGDRETPVLAARSRKPLRPGHDPAGAAPGFQCAVSELPEAAGGPAGGDAAPAGDVQRLADAPAQPGIAGKAEHAAHASGLAPCHDLVPAEAGVGPDDDPGLRPGGADLRHNPPELVKGTVRGVPARGAQPAARDMLATGDMEGKMAVAAIIAVKEPALLPAMHRIIGGIHVQDDLLGCLLMRLEEQIDEQPVDPAGIGNDPLATVGPGPLRAARLQPVQRARCRKGMAAIAQPGTMAADQVRAAAGRRKGRIVPQPVVMARILMAGRKRHDTPGNRQGNGMPAPPPNAIIGKAGGKTPGDVQEPVSLPQQKGTAIGRHPSAVECPDDTAPSRSFEFRLPWCKPRLHGVGSPGIGKCLNSLTNTTESNPMYTLVVNYAG